MKQPFWSSNVPGAPFLRRLKGHQVTQNDLVTWPEMAWSLNLPKSYKIGPWTRTGNFISLRQSVFFFFAMCETPEGVQTLTAQRRFIIKETPMLGVTILGLHAGTRCRKDEDFKMHNISCAKAVALRTPGVFFMFKENIRREVKAPLPTQCG